MIIDLSPVSRTAILTLVCRAIEAEKNKSEFNDPMAVFCLERLMSIASEEDKRWIIGEKRIYEGFHACDAEAGARRGKVFNNATSRFILDNPKCTIIDLACGFDTRFWRIENDLKVIGEEKGSAGPIITISINTTQPAVAGALDKVQQENG